ncbi:hypothetical protein XENOCAPTIV_025118, partial [Xenoophorus captivus]
MIGSGIFMSPQFVLADVGSPRASLVIWALSGAVAMFAALTYTELGTIIPESGGEFMYILRIYGSCSTFFAAVTFILLVKPFSTAAVAISIAEYAMAPFYFSCQPPQLAVKCTAAVTILVVSTLNILNARIAVRVQVIFLKAQVLTLKVIVIGGMAEVIQTLIFTTVISLVVLIPGDFQSIVNYFSSLSQSHLCSHLTSGDEVREAVLHSCQRPRLPHSTSSTTEERTRFHSGPQRWPRPCRLWCLYHLPGPNCMLLSSPGRCSSLEGSPVAEGSGGRRRWQLGQNVTLQYRFLE